MLSDLVIQIIVVIGIISLVMLFVILYIRRMENKAWAEYNAHIKETESNLKPPVWTGTFEATNNIYGDTFDKMREYVRKHGVPDSWKEYDDIVQRKPDNVDAISTAWNLIKKDNPKLIDNAIHTHIMNETTNCHECKANFLIGKWIRERYGGNRPEVQAALMRMKSSGQYENVDELFQDFLDKLHSTTLREDMDNAERYK